MKLKIIESALLIAVVVFVAGCDADCLDFDRIVYNLLDGTYYVHCRQQLDGSYVPVLDEWGDTFEENPVQTGQTAEDFDCGTSLQFTAGPPLPHVRSAAAVPPGPAVAPDARSGQDSRLAQHAASQAYARYGFNNGYVPPPLHNPMIPVPSGFSPQKTTANASCPPNLPDVLFVNHLNNSITRMGFCPFSTKAVIPLVSRPLQVAVTPDGTTAVVSNYDNAISFVDLTKNSVSYTLLTDSTINPGGVAIAPNGKQVYVSSFNGTNSPVLVIDIASHSVLTKLNAQPWPLGLYVTPDGSRLWVTYPFQNGIDTFDLLTNTEVAVRSVNAPSGIAFNSTGTRAYVTSGMGPGGALVAFDTVALKQIASYAVGNYPVDASVMPGDRYVIVDNFASANRSLVDTVTGAVVTGTADPGATYTLGLVPVQ